MTDLLNSRQKIPSEGNLRQFVGKTQGMLKSSLLSVFDGSNGLFTGISSRLEAALNRKPRSSSTTSLSSPPFDAGNISLLPDLPQPHQADAHEGSRSPSIKAVLPMELEASGPDPYEKLSYKIEAPSSGSEEGDGYGPSTSLESTDRRFWLRSGSEGSVQSWASSLSIDSLTDETAVEAAEFMRSFVAQLFHDSASISLDQKARFGQLAQQEAGRLWFSRFVNAQRVHFKRVPEATFYSLVQYFAIILFECSEADDFSPAKSLMNMCFTFYHEICDPKPRRQYVYSMLMDQPIWQGLRFWNAAFFDALQCERSHRPVATRDDVANNRLEALTDEKQFQENIAFGQLGTFTSNMHAFGLSNELCLEFLRKQCVIANLNTEQEKMLRENVDNLYRSSESRH